MLLFRYFNDNLNDFFATLLAIITTLNSITIPVSYSIISEKYMEYLDKSVSDKFIKNNKFRCNIIISFICIGVYLIPLISNVNLKYDYLINNYGEATYCLRNAYVYVSCFLFLWFLISFYRFSYYVYEYSTNTDEIIFDQIKSDIDAYLSK